MKGERPAPEWGYSHKFNQGKHMPNSHSEVHIHVHTPWKATASPEKAQWTSATSCSNMSKAAPSSRSSQITKPAQPLMYLVSNKEMGRGFPKKQPVLAISQRQWEIYYPLWSEVSSTHCWKAELQTPGVIWRGNVLSVCSECCNLCSFPHISSGEVLGANCQEMDAQF